MKKNSLLSVIFLAVLASSASAASTQLQSEPVVLPTYVVESTRYAEVEQYVMASLNALRAQAVKPVRVSIDLPALQARVAAVAKPLVALRLAKS